MMKNRLLTVLAVWLLAGPMAANAGILMTITDDGTDLTMSATGTYDNTGLTSLGSIFLGANAAVANFCCYGWETPNVGITYAATYSGALTSTGSIYPADIVSTTNPFFFWFSQGAIAFDSAAPLIGSVNESATFFGVTLASLGMVAGESVAVTWGNNVGTIQTSAAVPEPGTLALLGLGLAGLYFANRRKIA